MSKSDVVSVVLRGTRRPARMRPALGHDWGVVHQGVRRCTRPGCHSRTFVTRGVTRGWATLFARNESQWVRNVVDIPDWRRCYGNPVRKAVD